MDNSNIDIIYLAVNSVSLLICMVFGILLLDMRNYRRSISKYPIYPFRYMKARRALGISYIILGILTTLKLILDLPEKQEEFLPVSGLVVSSSQALLFIYALLSLYNSRLVCNKIIWSNVIPIIIFPLLYIIFSHTKAEQIIIRYLFFAYYILQLIIYPIFFFRERHNYLDAIEWYFDYGSTYRFYSKQGITIMFLCSLGIGIAALASYFFTELWQMTVFIAAYTGYYVWVGCYFLNYASDSQKIQHVTTPEDWARTGKYSSDL